MRLQKSHEYYAKFNITYWDLFVFACLVGRQKTSNYHWNRSHIQSQKLSKTALHKEVVKLLSSIKGPNEKSFFCVFQLWYWTKWHCKQFLSMFSSIVWIYEKCFMHYKLSSPLVALNVLVPFFSYYSITILLWWWEDSRSAIWNLNLLHSCFPFERSLYKLGQSIINARFH